jgi:hypothetical protein
LLAWLSGQASDDRHSIMDAVIYKLLLLYFILIRLTGNR